MTTHTLIIIIIYYYYYYYLTQRYTATVTETEKLRDGYLSLRFVEPNHTYKEGHNSYRFM
jgi:hypothetical protein